MVIQVSSDLYLHHTQLPPLMQVLGPPLVRCITLFLYSYLIHPPLPRKRGIHPYWLLWTTLGESLQWALPQEILRLTSPMSRLVFLSLFSTFLPQVRDSTISYQSKVTRILFETPLTPLGSNFHPLYFYETIISCLTSNFWDQFPEVTSIYEPHHGDTSVFGPVLASCFPFTTHAGSRAIAHKAHHFHF